MLDSVRVDLRYAMRSLRRQPLFATLVALTLGLGIGANASLFFLIDRLFFRPPPFMLTPALMHRIYTVQTAGTMERAQSTFPFARYKDFASARSFVRTAAFTVRRMPIGVGEATREVPIGVVSASFFEFFNAPPAIGRYFGESEDRPPEGSAVVVLAYPTWQMQYGGRRDVVGSTVKVGSDVFTIIGVAPRWFVGVWPEQPPAAFIPLSKHAMTLARQLPGFSNSWWLTYRWGAISMIARRKVATSVAAANADLTKALAASYESQRIENPSIPSAALARPRAIVGPIQSERGPNACPYPAQAR